MDMLFQLRYKIQNNTCIMCVWNIKISVVWIKQENKLKNILELFAYKHNFHILISILVS